MRELRILNWWPAATLVVCAAIGAVVIATVVARGGDGETQVHGPSPSPVRTETRPAAPSNTAPPEACATTRPTEVAEEPTLFDTLDDGASTDDPNFEVEFGVEAADGAAHANGDLTLDMTVRAGNVAPAAFYVLVPPEWGITPGCQIPIGLTVGSLHWDARVGLDGNP